MKIAAHPMLVAVAFGFLGPAALERDEEGERASTSGNVAAPVVAPAVQPTQAETERVAALWREIRSL